MIGHIDLPWPDKILSPNARVHWAPKAKASRAARETAWALVRQTYVHAPSWARVAVSYTFCPPDKRRRDRDNLIASMKAATDGIADALEIDDSKFETTYRMGAPVKGGAVLVTISEAKP
jgi:crossover junction endodeoxyribonuclease RusA